MRFRRSGISIQSCAEDTSPSLATATPPALPDAAARPPAMAEKLL